MRKALLALLILLLVALAAFVGYAAGRAAEPETTFYAVIEQVQGQSILVQGLQVNDVNYRGRFHFTVTEKTQLSWRGTELALAELEPGDTVSITFTGAVRESEPAGLERVLRIQLLDDEK